VSAGRPQRVPWAGPLGLHRPGTSPVHRAPAGLKLVLLAAVGAVLVVRTGPVVAAVGLLVVIALGVVARTPWRTSTRGLVPVLLTAAALGGYQTWARGAA